MRKGLN